MSQPSRRVVLTGALATALLAACRWKAQSVYFEETPGADRHVVLSGDPPHFLRVVLADRSTVEGKLVGATDTAMQLRDPKTGADQWIAYADVMTLYIGRDAAEVAAGRGRKVDDVASQAVFRSGTALLVLVAVLGVAFLIVMIIAIASKMSCPFVYAVRDGRRVLLGEVYSGAVFGALARADRLGIGTAEGTRLELVLSNHAPETQYTDQAVVVLFSHPEDLRILPGVRDRAVAVGDRVLPTSAVDRLGTSFTEAVDPDRDGAFFTDLTAAVDEKPRPSHETLEARFEAAPDRPVLELLLQSSPWLDHVALQGAAAMAEDLGEAQARNRDPARRAALEADVRSAGIDTEVQVADGAGWRTVAWVPPVGWAAARTVAVPLDGVAAGEPVTVRLRGGIGFLVVHGLALAEGRDLPEPVELQAVEAVHSNGGDERARLAAVDGDPNVLAEYGEETRLVFELPAATEGMVRTAQLQVHGYYEIHPVPGAVRRPATAWAIGSPDQLGAAALDLYAQYLDAHERALAEASP